jgi:hypothetical protein
MRAVGNACAGVRGLRVPDACPCTRCSASCPDIISSCTVDAASMLPGRLSAAACPCWGGQLAKSAPAQAYRRTLPGRDAAWTALPAASRATVAASRRAVHMPWCIP